MPIARRRQWTVAILIFAAVAVIGGLWLFSSLPHVPFLSARAPARWIFYPTYERSHRGALLDTTFRKSFELSSAPATARLTVRGFRAFEVRINGAIAKRPAERRLWKEPTTLDVTGLLNEGANELEAVVSNDSGPPALWLALDCDDVQITSDTSWRASHAGGTELDAVLASDPDYRVWLDPPLPRPWESFFQQLPLLLLWAGISAAVWLLIEWIVERRSSSRLVAGELSPRVVWILVALWCVAWFVQGVMNLRFLQPEDGFDIRWHLMNVSYIQQNHALPPPDHGHEAHQPPLYYMLAAATLECLRLDARHPAGITALRWLSMVLAVVHVVLTMLVARRLFRGAVPLAASLVVAGFLPVQAYIFQFISNEPLVAVLGSATTYLALRALQSSRPSLWLYAGVGACLGAGLSTKLTAVALVPVVFAALGGQLVLRYRWQIGRWLAPLCVLFAATLIVGGGHYLRLWHELGSPLARRIDLEGERYWVQPGFHTATHFFRFGESLTEPFFAGTYSLPDALYSTLWGAARFSGSGVLQVRPPWNYSLMACGYMLALAVCVFIVLGLAVLVVRLVRRPSAVRFLWLGLPATMAVALAYENLHHPYVWVAKAWYALPVSSLICAAAGLGCAVIARAGFLGRGVVFVVLGTWALCSWFSFSIVPDATTYATLAISSFQEGRRDEAVANVRQALDLNPRHALATRMKGNLLMADRKAADAAFRLALEVEPNSADAHHQLGVLLGAAGRIDEAELHLLRAVELAPDNAAMHFTLADMYMQLRRRRDAIEQFRETLRIKPYDVQAHRRLVNLYQQAGDALCAEQHRKYVEVLEADEHAAD